MGDSIDQGDHAFVVDTVPVLNRIGVAKVKGSQRGVVPDQIEEHLLEFAPVDVVVLQLQGHYPIIVTNPVDEGF